jgi:probable rRNA maturation factor
MIEVVIAVEPLWGAEEGWESCAIRAVDAAVSASHAAAILAADVVVEVSFRFADDAEVQTLNRDYRQKDKATNVLSFPMHEPDEIGGLAHSDDPELMLGDIILAHGVCACEAAERNISVEAHATHLIVHGTLHLLGYDHIDEGEAAVMESLEQKIMASLGLHDPYAPIED